LKGAETANLPKKNKTNSTLTYFLVFILLMFLLALTFPSQSAQFINAFFKVFENITSFGQIIVVAVVIGLIVYLLKRAGKI
jgi:hypothetical protein